MLLQGGKQTQEWILSAHTYSTPLLDETQLLLCPKPSHCEQKDHCFGCITSVLDASRLEKGRKEAEALAKVQEIQSPREFRLSQAHHYVTQGQARHCTSNLREDFHLHLNSHKSKI